MAKYWACSTTSDVKTLTQNYLWLEGPALVLGRKAIPIQSKCMAENQGSNCRQFAPSLHFYSASWCHWTSQQFSQSACQQQLLVPGDQLHLCQRPSGTAETHLAANLFPARPAQGIPALILSVLGDSRVCSLCWHPLSTVRSQLLSTPACLWLQTKSLHTWSFGNLLPGFPKEKKHLGLMSELRDIRKEIEDLGARPQSSIFGPVQEAVSGDLIVSSPERKAHCHKTFLCKSCMQISRRSMRWAGELKLA